MTLSFSRLSDISARDRETDITERILAAAMKSLVVLVACLASLVQADPSWYPAWQGPINIPVVLPSGHLADTPEVAALKQAHAVAVANSPGGGEIHPAWPGYAPLYAPWAAPYPSWHGPINIPVVLPSGHLADTPEVAALRAAHAAALANSYH